jgi:hypothetical protein
LRKGLYNGEVAPTLATYTDTVRRVQWIITRFTEDVIKTRAEECIQSVH